MTKLCVPVLALVALVLAACGGASDQQWYETRCAERYELTRGTAEFTACVDRERRTLEESRRRTDRSTGSL